MTVEISEGAGREAGGRDRVTPRADRRCVRCGHVESAGYGGVCSACGGELHLVYREQSDTQPEPPGAMWDYFDRLPVSSPSSVISLGEGMTPLLRAGGWAAEAYWKNEGANPTGSQKDRAVSVAISVALEKGYRRVVTASTGSVGLSCAAYCAKAKLPCAVLVPAGTPVERLRPMMAFGARVVTVDGTFEDVMRILDRLDRSEWYETSTILARNVYQGEGPKTIAYEIHQQLGQVPDWIVVPVGGGGTLAGIWKGFSELKAQGLIDRTPRLAAVQARAFNFFERVGNVATLDEAELRHLVPDERQHTIARNLKHGFPPDGHHAYRAVRQSNGLFLSVSDDEALVWQLRIARKDGIFCEPSSAVVAAALARLAESGTIKPSDKVVGILTGAGYRELGALPEDEPLSASPDLGPPELAAIVDLAAAH